MPVAELRTIDPSRVTFTVNGHTITGFADGEVIRAEHTENAYDLVIGVQGHALRMRRAGRPGTIRVRLLPTSPSIQIIRALEGRVDPFPVVCTDSNDGVDKGFVAEEAWLQRAPGFIRAKDGGGNVVEVTFETHNLVFNV